MRPSPLLLRNVHQVAEFLQGVVGMGKPPRCGRCGRTFATVPERYARWDAISRIWVAFLECPGCRAEYVYMRKGDPPTVRDDAR